MRTEFEKKSLEKALRKLVEDGVLNNEESVNDESFMNSLLECPQYTRPEDFMGLKVPKILRSGDHKKIKEYRLSEAIEITKKYRPDLYKKYKEATNE